MWSLHKLSQNWSSIIYEAENDELVKSIFSDKKVFEKEILNVTCNSDRIEVMDIFAKRIVQILLKEELNFYIWKTWVVSGSLWFLTYSSVR